MLRNESVVLSEMCHTVNEWQTSPAMISCCIAYILICCSIRKLCLLHTARVARMYRFWLMCVCVCVCLGAKNS